MKIRAHNAVDHSNRQINSWFIVSYSHTDKERKSNYLCRCICGKEIIKPIQKILNQTVKSCGCMNAPRFIIELKDIKFGNAKPEWSDNWQGEVFVIKLGEIINPTI